jgi:hypothetical protein
MKNRDEKKRIIQLKISKKINNKKMGNTWVSIYLK